MTGLRSATAVLALFASTHAQVAAAQECISEAEVAALFVYAMPSALESVKNSCDERLQPDGFFATRGASLVSQYAALQDESWPKAKRALLMFANSGGGSGMKSKDYPGIDPNKLMRSLPDDVVRPLVDAVIVEKVAESVKPQHCRNIERVASAIAPIEPRTAAVLIGTIMGLVDTKQPQVCAVEQ